MMKQIMIPLAAFAVTVTGASAFNGDWLNKIDVDLSEAQISALTEVQEKRADGATREEVSAILDEAGLDRTKMIEVKTAMHELRQTMHEEVENALESGDYEAFLKAVDGTPMADKITTKENFEKMVEAHEMREQGDFEGAQEIMSELGIERVQGEGCHGGRMGEGKGLGNHSEGGEKGGKGGHGHMGDGDELGRS